MKDAKVAGKDRISRRNFISAIAGVGAGFTAGIVGSGIAGPGFFAQEEAREKVGEAAEKGEKKEEASEASQKVKEEAKIERSGEDTFKTNIDEAMAVPRTKDSMPGRYPGVVCEIYHPKAVEGASTAASATAVAAMLAAGMKSLTGEKKEKKAWARFFSPMDRVGIKINPIGGKLLSNNHELIGAIIARLEAVGVPRKNIVLWDRREVQMTDSGFTAERYPGITCIGTEYMVKEGDKEFWKGDDRLDKGVFYEFDIVGEYDEETMPYMIHGGTKSYFTNILTQMVDKVINVPVLKNAGPTATLCLKNMAFGVTSNTARGHRIWNRYNAEVCAFSPVRDKVVLNIVDGLRGCYEGGPAAVAQYIWNANTIWIATDPVAADRIAWEKIFEKRIKEGIAQKEQWDPLLEKYNKLSRAEKLGLGTCARERIIHHRVDLA